MINNCVKDMKNTFSTKQNNMIKMFCSSMGTDKMKSMESKILETHVPMFSCQDQFLKWRI